MSTGETVRGRAEAWASQRFDEINAEQTTPIEVPFLTVYSENFFAWESPWCVDKRASGKRISQRECIEKTRLLKNRVIPALGHLRLDEIDALTIKSFRNNLFQSGLSGSSINKILIIIRAILLSAEEQGLIKALPRIHRAADRPKEKGVLSIDEVRALFASEWWDYRGRVACMISATAGLRASELQALTFEDLHLDDLYITVSKAWDERMRCMNTTTKNGLTRNVFIPRAVAEEIRQLIKVHPNPARGSFLFFADKRADKPCERVIFVKSFFKAMKNIGISEKARQERNISLHSLRHFANSLFVNAGLPLLRVQAIIGHQSAEMSKRYYHNMENGDDIRQIQESLFE